MQPDIPPAADLIMARFESDDDGGEIMEPITLANKRKRKVKVSPIKIKAKKKRNNCVRRTARSGRILSRWEVYEQLFKEPDVVPNSNDPSVD